MVKAFKQLKLSKKYTIRFFYKKDEMLYQWHADKEMRDVWFLPLGKWQFQYNDELPTKISPLYIVWIPKDTYHRIIRKSGILIAFIKHSVH